MIFLEGEVLHTSSNHNLKKEKVMYVSVPKSHDNINTDH